MATVGITCSYRGKENVPVLRSDTLLSEVITSSGTSQQTTGTATLDGYWRIAVSGGPVWVKAGVNPTAAAGNDYLIPSEGVLELQAESGDKLAIIDA